MGQDFFSSVAKEQQAEMKDTMYVESKDTGPEIADRRKVGNRKRKYMASQSRCKRG